MSKSLKLTNCFSVTDTKPANEMIVGMPVCAWVIASAALIISLRKTMSRCRFR